MVAVGPEAVVQTARAVALAAVSGPVDRATARPAAGATEAGPTELGAAKPAERHESVARQGQNGAMAGGAWDGSPLAGRLLLATPLISEGVFARSVILVLHHDDSGTQGVVLNRPLDAPVDAVLPGWQDVLTDPTNLFQGGPVQLDSAIGLVTVPGPSDAPVGVKRLFGKVGVIDLDTPPQLVSTGLAGMRVFAGYAGWSDGQLEAEIGTGSWYVVEAEPRDAFSGHPRDLWQTVLRRQRDELAWMATFPADPDLN